MLPKMRAAGINLVLGDDYGFAMMPHGDYASEMEAYVKYGVPPIEVMQWGTRNGARAMGRHGAELGEVEELPYLVMEYVPGSTLRQLQQAALSKEKKLPVGVVVDLAAQACAGTHAVHELEDSQGRPMGLVHRDLTPHNLMVTDDGFVKLLDFGIVKATEGPEEARTRTGILKGKVAFLICVGNRKAKGPLKNANQVYNYLKPISKDSNKRINWMNPFPVQLQGTDLLGKQLGVENVIVGFLKKYVGELTDPWRDRRSRAAR